MTRPLVLPDHNLQAEVFAVLPVCETVEVDVVAFRVYDRFNYANSEEDLLPADLEAAVADWLRRLRDKGWAEKVGNGWKRSGASAGRAGPLAATTPMAEATSTPGTE